VIKKIQGETIAVGINDTIIAH